MRRRVGFTVAAALVALAWVAPAAAAAEASPTAVIVGADASAYPEVSLVVDVPRELAPDETMTVVEAGRHRPARIVAGAAALEVVVAVDTSGSMKGATLVAAKTAAAEFVDRLPDGSRAAIVGFGQRPYVVTPMTGDRGALRAGVDGLAAGGETALYDALAVATSQFSEGPHTRSIVLVSDGGDTASSTHLPEVKELLQSRAVRLFGVHLITSEAQRAVVEDLAAATSGRVAAASDAGDLGSTYAAVTADVVRQVRLTYRSTAAGSTPVSVLIGSGASVLTSPALVVELPVPPAELPPPRAAIPSPAVVDRSALAVGAGAVFVALAVAWLLVLVRPRRSLLARRRVRSSALHHDLKVRAGEVVERTLERRGSRRALGARLEVAGVALRPGEYVVLVGGAALLALFTGVLVGGLVLGLFFAAGAWVLAKVLLRSRTNKRRGELEKQLPDLLQQLISSLRAGYGVMQAIDAASREMAEPMAGELHRLFTEVQLGRDLTESLRALADRLAGQDFEWVVQAIEINREVGGELVEVLESVAETIRARDHLRRQVKTLSAQGRLSARILLAMPFVMALLLSVLSPGYLGPLLTRGRFVLVLGAVLMTFGYVWTRRLVRPRF